MPGTEHLSATEWRALVGASQDTLRKFGRFRHSLVALLLAQVRLCGLPEPDLEFRFAPPRRWRFDLAWPERLVACEYEGLHAAKSRHTTVTGFIADCEKYNHATLAGWRVYRVTAKHVEDGSALLLLESALAQ